MIQVFGRGSALALGGADLYGMRLICATAAERAKRVGRSSRTDVYDNAQNENGKGCTP